jgi:prephenate dehydrogenase
MGGSFGKSLKNYNLCENRIGYDHNKNHQKEALEYGLVDKIVDLEELKGADMIVLAIPVDAIITFLPSLVGVSKNTTIVDFGSTKELIVKNIPKELYGQFIAAHPMTGTEKFGPSAAMEKLYKNKIMVLCDLNKCDQVHKDRAISIFEALEMRLVFMDSHEHDIHACYISHLPHAISFALANMVMNHEEPKHITSLAAGGFRDMSRIAKSSPDMWTDIFRQNKQNLIESLELYEKQVGYIKKLLKEDDYDGVKEWMKKSNTLHDIL